MVMEGTFGNAKDHADESMDWETRGTKKKGRKGKWHKQKVVSI